MAEEIENEDKKMLEQSNAIADEAQNAEQEKLDGVMEKDYEQLEKNMLKQADAFGNIDDHYVSNLPTFMLKDFLDDKFGDHKTADAKMRFAYFLVNGVQSKLKNVSNAAAIAAGKSPMFADTQSDYDKIRSTNLYQGLENRWNKNKESTQSAINLAKKQGMDEQDLQSSLNKISMNARMNNAFNKMDEKQKLYTIKIMNDIGDYVKDMNVDQLTNLMIGGSLSGNDVSYEDMLAITVSKSLPALKGYASEISSRLAKGEKIQEILSDLLSKGPSKPEEMGDENTETGSVAPDSKKNLLTGETYAPIKLSDGSEIVLNTALTKDQFNNEVVKKYDEIRVKFINGEIDRTTAEKDLKAIYDEVQKHKWFTFFKDNLIPPSQALGIDEALIEHNKIQAEKAEKKAAKAEAKAEKKEAKAEKKAAKKENKK